ncbi:hypothetical protein DFQ28_004925 [Apophysomyces sp. BC1034]|nr:hypothetical protein DFQ30_005119 [Apophysomyces sp. BC1015]KAG0177970.1 hypothetical protein DFQ29_004127 [Apophysomyces sp. BC1021]KAG0188376.1 hypothetical protein DFQ28_004925 [Apophysomyces sp. BC1034]
MVSPVATEPKNTSHFASLPAKNQKAGDAEVQDLTEMLNKKLVTQAKDLSPVDTPQSLSSSSSSSDISLQADTMVSYVAKELNCPHASECGRIISRFVMHFDKKLRYHYRDPALDRFLEHGQFGFANKVHGYVCASKTILMVLPAFPCKSPNPRTKVIGELPDRTEEIAIAKMNNFCAEVCEYYPAGAELTIVSDGRVFADLVGVADHLVTEYNDFLQYVMFKDRPKHIVYRSLDDHLTNGEVQEIHQASEHDQRRAGLMEAFQNEKEGNSLVKVGFVRYLMEDRVWPDDMSKNQIKKFCRDTADRMIQRNVAFSRLCEHYYPDHLRLSIHSYDSSGPKYPVQIAPNHGGPTPWHSCAVELANGETWFVKRSVADSLVQQGHLELYEHEEFKRPWAYRQITTDTLDMIKIVA